jgi:hypothetical protein
MAPKRREEPLCTGTAFDKTGRVGEISVERVAVECVAVECVAVERVAVECVAVERVAPEVSESSSDAEEERLLEVAGGSCTVAIALIESLGVDAESVSSDSSSESSSDSSGWGFLSSISSDSMSSETRTS